MTNLPRAKWAVVLGGGITGLTTAWKLAKKGWSVAVLEKRDHVGGLADTFAYKDMKLDRGPHKIYTQIPEVQKFFENLHGEDLLEIPKLSGVCLNGKILPYPVGIKDLLLSLNPLVGLHCGLSYAWAKVRSIVGRPKDDSYEAFLVNRFGRAAFNLTFGPMAAKIWGDPKSLSAELARKRVVIPSLPELLKRMLLGDGGKKEITAKCFYYPRQGIQEVSERLAVQIRKMGGLVELKAEPTRVVTKNYGVESVTYKDGSGKEQTIVVDALVSTIPPAGLVDILDPAPPKEIAAAAHDLHFRSLILVNLIIKKERLFKEAFIFFPEKDLPFNRLSEQKAFSAEMIPGEKTALCCETVCEPDDARWQMTDEALVEQMTGALVKMGWIKREDVIDHVVTRVPRCYPVYDQAYLRNLSMTLTYLHGFKNLYSNGRPGLFNYNNMDHCVDMGLKVGDFVAAGRPKTEWPALLREFDNYQIID